MFLIRVGKAADGSKVHLAKCSSLSLMALSSDDDYDTRNQVFSVRNITRVYPQRDESRTSTENRSSTSIHLLIFNNGGRPRIVPALRANTTHTRCGRYVIPGKESVWAAPFVEYARAHLLPDSMSDMEFVFPPGNGLGAAALITNDTRVWSRTRAVESIPDALRGFVSLEDAQAQVWPLSLKRWFPEPEVLRAVRCYATDTIRVRTPAVSTVSICAREPGLVPEILDAARAVEQMVPWDIGACASQPADEYACDLPEKSGGSEGPEDAPAPLNNEDVEDEDSEDGDSEDQDADKDGAWISCESSTPMFDDGAEPACSNDREHIACEPGAVYDDPGDTCVSFDDYGISTGVDAYFNADSAALVGDAPFFAEVTRAMAACAGAEMLAVAFVYEDTEDGEEDAEWQSEPASDFFLPFDLPDATRV